MQFPILPVSDKVHVINSCDESLIYYSVFGSEDACTSAVVRPRGGLITPRNPVHPGEPLVAFAYGMGDATPSPVSVPFQAGLTKQPFILRYAGAGGPACLAQAPDRGFSDYVKRNVRNTLYGSTASRFPAASMRAGRHLRQYEGQRFGNALERHL